ncbi:MAG TPA: nucleotide pyrophosphohydrolase [Nocardioidaceae bacterium]|nr:nucleotide pyrophosphohydrolase [Nocardioidaceae bacterium]
MDLAQLQQRALEIAARYDELNLAERGHTWTRADTMMGFVGDVGDLAKLSMAADGVREMPDHKRALGHELADCLWSVLVLAKAHDVDLEAEFVGCMDMLETAIDRQLEG